MAAFVCGLLAFGPTRVLAQTTPPAPGRRPWTIAPYVAVSVASPVGHRWGLTPDRRHFFFGIHATTVIVERPRWSFRYAPEVVPLLVVTNNPKYLITRVSVGTSGDDEPPRREGILITEDGTGPVAGFAMSPIGFEARSPLSPRVEAYADGALGAVWFTRQVPILNARLFNFTAQFGGGLVWKIGPVYSVRAGYKFHHLSNAQTAPENPGIDGHVLLVGFERTFGGQ